ncbi:MAG: DUF4391 domain-containing protein [Hyphomicrobiales bacterium]|uniref:DUF4391 domain-containing protein n=1 Tax=Brevundimonas sp. 357 TaxID=2555782 RepID=UPI000F78E9B4|nr:DUF4391 domain-containing protein [Brevundimonas sp. 357]MCP5365824.1 DUF4391 domain-containing protein [Hyphomicrobiales bacterium]RSB40951.1 DUF4391 domain-containing protein [Brevundimonas sp. 357]
MTAGAGFLIIVNALGLPPSARVDVRVPKKLLVEQGAPTAADKRAIQDGIDELQWFAACKPATIGVQAFSDDTREYLEIAIVGCVFRPGAKAARLIELIHRAIPYPVLLVTVDESGLSVSAAHKRHAQNDSGRTVIEHVVTAGSIRADAVDSVQIAFLKSLALAQQPRTDLFALYTGWIARIEAINAARLTGAFVATDDQEALDRRREALDAHARLTKEIESLRAKARHEKRLSRRVDLNLEIQRREADLTGYTKWL